MTGRREQGSVSKSWELPHEPAKVWRALTEPALIAQWMMETDLSLEPGKEFTFRTKPSAWWDGIIHSRILELVPQKRISYAWISKAGAHPLDTTVTWTLSAIPGGTRLELEHKGFRLDKAGQKFAFQGADQGWDRNVGERLAALLRAVPLK